MSIQLTKQQLQALGIQNASESEKDTFLIRVGQIVFDAAILRLLETFSEEQMTAFTYAVDSYDSFDATLAHIMHTHPVFNTFLTQEQNLFVDSFTSRIETRGV